jgi:hypothetical protein
VASLIRFPLSSSRISEPAWITLVCHILSYYFSDRCRSHRSSFVSYLDHQWILWCRFCFTCWDGCYAFDLISISQAWSQLFPSRASCLPSLFPWFIFPCLILFVILALVYRCFSRRVSALHSISQWLLQWTPVNERKSILLWMLEVIRKERILYAYHLFFFKPYSLVRPAGVVSQRSSVW